MDDSDGGNQATVDMTRAERAKLGATSRWTVDADGNDVMPPLQRHYLEDYLLQARPQGVNKTDWCKTNDVPVRSTRNWEKDDRFRREWHRRLHEMRLSPEWMGDVISSMHKIATDPNHPKAVSAGESLLKFMGMMSPQQVEVKVDRSALSEMDTVELARLASSVPELEAG